MGATSVPDEDMQQTLEVRRNSRVSAILWTESTPLERQLRPFGCSLARFRAIISSLYLILVYDSQTVEKKRSARTSPTRLIYWVKCFNSKSSILPVSEDTGIAAQWEYKTVEPPRDSTMEEASDPKELLNEYGGEGWELADTITYSGGGTKFLAFKRPLNQK